MNIDFDNPKHEALANNYDSLRKRYDKKGQAVAVEIIGVIDVLRAADTLLDVPRGYRPHPLKGEYKGCFAVDVTNTHRVIFRPNHESFAE